MQPADLPFAVELANTMKWGMSAADFQFNMKLEPEGCFVLFDEQEAAGVATCINYGAVGWFGNLVISQKYKKKGAGTFLLTHAVDYLQSKGVSQIGLYAYPYLLDFYGKVGFKPDMEFAVLKAKTIYASEDMQLEQAHMQDLQRIADFDSRFFGTSRKKVLEQIFLGKQNFCRLIQENSRIMGYAATKNVSGTAEVGPLVCDKKQPENAVTLLKGILSELNGVEGIMCVPATQTALIETAVLAGFREEFRLVRMFLGSRVGEDCWYLAESLERG